MFCSCCEGGRSITFIVCLLWYSHETRSSKSPRLTVGYETTTEVDSNYLEMSRTIETQERT